MSIFKLTEYGNLPIKNKNFAWSISSLKGFQTCPLQMWATRLAEEPFRIPYMEGEAAKAGNEVHKAFENAVKDGTYQLPPEWASLQSWADHLKPVPGGHHPEMKYAFNKDWEPVAWNRWNRVWCRVIMDFVSFNGREAILIDYKNGKSKYVSEDQLKLGAIATFTESAVDVVKAGFWYFQENKVVQVEYNRREVHGMKVEFENQAQPMEEAFHSGTFPPNKNFLCKEWCPVAYCPHWGGGAKCGNNKIIQDG